MSKATFTIGQEPKMDVSKLTKDRNAEPPQFEFISCDTTLRIREGIAAAKARQNERDLLRGAA